MPFENFRFKPRLCVVCNLEYLPNSGTQVICYDKDTPHLQFKHKRKRQNALRNYELRGRFTAQKRRARRKHWLDKYKCAKGCSLCGWNKHSSALDWDHLNSDEKLINIGRSLESQRRRLFIEIRKCRILCANCHRIHSAETNVYFNKTLRARGFKNK